ncbi:NADH:ubiquinone reductase (Na(+)-transporting) subunit F [Hyphomonas johnsonii]|uniref:Na(+)-translocating NADH-quinone reductase subunit F n=1 Tax=Hyphomonas johnsonii MHS-2 TaxID=1280950 RepID=A0A059FBM9_9PROT|nr:NADH:ubiquinone reductase (Na(+)-transporting) subunit F [Hyphomonas johnsonii]KCZ87966.1 Na(+)-translocating NADH-quinone reductase subunit F [Hyphomonas johnsonii MHS-2]
MIIVRRIHKWIGLILGLQLALWMLSGLGMAVLPHDLVSGDHRRAEHGALPPVQLSSLEIRDPTPVERSNIHEIRLNILNGRAVLETVSTDGASLSDAVTGYPIAIDETLAMEVALNDYSGPGAVTEMAYVSIPKLETRSHAAPAWRVSFDDPEHTSIYVSATNGQIQERRNNYWRTFDIFWMLHIMDYQNRSNFNHPIIVISAILAVWMGLSGIVLWRDSLRRHDFNLIGKWRNRNNSHTLSVTDSDGGAIKAVRATPLQTLYAAMDANGYPLPSSCGGGGTCGLCRVKISPETTVLPADRRQIPESEIQAGYRLACQHPVSTDLCVTLPHGLLDAQTFTGKIVSSTFISPDLCELRITLPEMLAFRAGSYLQVKIPPFESHLDKLDLPEFVRERWHASGTAEHFGTDRTVYRTYSLANSPGELGNDIMLNVRLALARPDTSGVPVGIGSAFLSTLTLGDSITLKGPFGDFHVKDADDEIIFIGGGAGIAPIRSMIQDQLSVRGRTSKISFWYGARTPEDIVYSDEFAQLADTYRNFSWHVALSHLDKDDTWSGERGLIHEFVRDQYLASHPDIGRCRFYVCGPPPMLEAVLKSLAALGVPEDRIAFDDFGS